MSSYPPPPQPDQQHYNPTYSAVDKPQQLDHQDVLDTAQQAQLAFDLTNQHVQLDPKDEPHSNPLSEDNAESHIEQRIEQLQHHDPDAQLSFVGLDSAGLAAAAAEHESDPTQSHIDTAPIHDSARPQTESQPKINRLRKACDSCSIRKVKCDENTQPCKACVQLDIPCTFERPSRRRGPPNRHAEAIKRRRIDLPFASLPDEPTSPTHAAQALAALSSQSATTQISAESICAVDTVDLLINDYFTHLHPLYPFPHEPSFREAWRRREDYNNRPFLALLASMLAALVASFPRKPRLHIVAQRKDSVYPNHLALVDKCQKVCALARGPGYLDSDTLSVHDAATSFLLGMAAVYTFNWRQSRLYLGESMTILRALHLHKAKEDTFNDLGGLPIVLGCDGPSHEGSRDHIVDRITLQMGRRIFWTIFTTVESMSQSGGNPSELYIAPATPNDPYPPLPEEVDDFRIFPAHIEPQPPDQIPLIVHFNSAVRLYWSYNLFQNAMTALGSGVDWQTFESAVRELLKECSNTSLVLDVSQQDEPMQRDPASLTAAEHESASEPRRDLQYSIQKKHLYANALFTKLVVVDAVLDLLDAQNAQATMTSAADEQPTDTNGDGVADHHSQLRIDLLAERESLATSVSVALCRLDQLNIAPHADSYNQKIRYVAKALIDTVKERKEGPIMQNVEGCLRAITESLSALDNTNLPAGLDDAAQDDDMRSLLAYVRETQGTLSLQVGVGIEGA